jgi:hypothetical protein
LLSCTGTTDTSYREVSCPVPLECPGQKFNCPETVPFVPMLI